MPRYVNEPRYEGGGGFFRNDPVDDEQPLIVIPDNNQVDQVTTDQVTADQNNYAIPPSGVVVFSTDASRNFTGFVMARPGLTVFCNGGSFDGVIVNNSASSTEENRVLCHTGANITLNPNESVILFYDFAASRVRTVGFV